MHSRAQTCQLETHETPYILGPVRRSQQVYRHVPTWIHLRLILAILLRPREIWPGTWA